MSTTSLGRVIDNVGALVLRQLTTWGLAMALVAFLPRYLGDQGMGKATFAEETLAVMWIACNLGINTYMVKRIANRHGEWNDLFWSAGAIGVTLGAVLLAVMLPLLALLRVEPQMRYLLYLTGATVIVTALQKMAEAAIQGLEKMRWLTMADIANKTVTTCVGIGVLLLGYHVVAFGAVVFAGACLALLIDMAALVRLGLAPPRVSRLFLRLLLRGGLPFLLTGAVAQVYQWSDVATLQALTRSAVLGWYGAALQLFSTLNFLPLILATALLPPMSRLYARGEDESFLALARNGIRLILLTSLPITVGLALVSGQVIGFLGYPAEFHHSVPVLIVLTSCLPLTGLLMVAYTTVVAMDRQAYWVKILCVSLALNLVLDIVLIEVFQRMYGNGGIGAAAASLVAESVQLALSLRAMPAGLFDSDLALQVLRAFGATTAMGLLVVYSQAMAFGLIATVLIGAVAYAVACLMLGAVRLSDISTLARTWSRADEADYIEVDVDRAAAAARIA